MTKNIVIGFNSQIKREAANKSQICHRYVLKRSKNLYFVRNTSCLVILWYNKRKN